MYPGKKRTPSELLLEVMKEETILFSLDNAETPKEKRVAYKNVQVKLENKGKIDLFKKCTNETGLLTSADHIDRPVGEVRSFHKERLTTLFLLHV